MGLRMGGRQLRKRSEKKSSMHWSGRIFGLGGMRLESSKVGFQGRDSIKDQRGEEEEKQNIDTLKTWCAYSNN